MTDERDAAVPESPRDDEERNGPALDEFFEILADRHRRHALYYLLDRDGSVSLGRLVREVLRREHGCDVDVLADQRCRRAYLTFYHDHAPRMASSGLLEFNDEEGVVRPTGAVDEYADYLEHARVDETELGVDDRAPPGHG